MRIKTAMYSGYQAEKMKLTGDCRTSAVKINKNIILKDL